MTDEKSELTYLDEDGNTVFTSTFLKNRGTCCRTECLHCPYGFTLKNHPIKIVEMEAKHIKFANEIISESKPVELSDLSLSLLSSAFGNKKKVRVHHITEDNINNFAFGEFKEKICAVIEFSNKLSESTRGRSIKDIFLKKEFQNQGLGIEHVK